MKILKLYFVVFIFCTFFLVLNEHVVLAANIVICNSSYSSIPGTYLTSDYRNDAACIQAALNDSTNGDNITILGGNYYLSTSVYQQNKSLNITGEGNVTLYLQTAEGEDSTDGGLYFAGSTITNQNLSANGVNGSSQITLTDASQVRQNDLIKIWKNIQWCPNDYPDQMTGEIYKVINVNGNTVTLNQPLLRDYNISDSSKIEDYRPITVNIKNLNIQGQSSTGDYLGLSLKHCVDSFVTNCMINNNGFSDLSLFSCFNVNVSNNNISNALHSGNGYGVAIWSGSAFINVTNNFITNCRHTITGNSDEDISLNRDLKFADNILVGGTVNGANVVDLHNVVINAIIINNTIYPKLPYFFAFDDGGGYTIFSNNTIIGGYGMVNKRGSVDNSTHIIQNNTMIGVNGYGFQGNNLSFGDTLSYIRNAQDAGSIGVYLADGESFKNVTIKNNTFSNLDNYGVYIVTSKDDTNIRVSENIFENIGRDAVYIDVKGHSNNITIQPNTMININIDGSGVQSGVEVLNLETKHNNLISQLLVVHRYVIGVLKYLNVRRFLSVHFEFVIPACLAGVFLH